MAFMPFQLGPFIPNYTDQAHSNQESFGQMFGRWNDQALAERRQSETERSNRVGEGQQDQQLDINRGMEGRLATAQAAKLKAAALELKRMGRDVEADQAWKLAAPDEAPPWSQPIQAAPPGMLPQGPAVAAPAADPMAQPVQEVPSMEFTTEEVDWRSKDLPPAPPLAPGQSPTHIPDARATPIGMLPPPAPPEPDSPAMGAVDEVVGVPGPQPPTAQAAPQASGDPFSAQNAGETKAVTDLFDAMLANEGELNEGLAQQIRAMAAPMMDVQRRSGGTPQDAAKALLDQYRSQARGNFGLETAKIRKKKGGGGGGQGAGAGGPSKDVYNMVRATVKDVGLEAKASEMSKAEGMLNQAISQAGSANSLGQRQALAGLVKSMFGAASSNQELQFVRDSGGVSNRLQTWLNTYVDGGQVPDEMLRQMVEELNRAKALMAQRRKALGDHAYNVLYNAQIPYASEEDKVKNSEWARGFYGRDFGGQGGMGPAAGEQVQAEDGETYEFTE